MPGRPDVSPAARRVSLAAFGDRVRHAGSAILLAPLVGSTPISLARVFDRSIPFADNVDAQIFFIARLPRVLAAALVGAALALAGVVFQALLRNPLASPDTLGVSAGAALGAMLAITFNADFSLLGVSAVPLASFAGSIGALAIVYGLSAARRRGTSTLVLLLGRRDADLAPLGDLGLRAVPGRLHRDAPDRPLADGVARRRRVHADRGGGRADGHRGHRLRHAAARCSI